MAPIALRDPRTARVSLAKPRASWSALRWALAWPLCALPAALAAAAEPSATLAPAQSAAPLQPTGLHFRVCCFSSSLASRDLDGDGDLDLVVGNDLSADVAVLLSDGKGGFADAVAYPLAGPVTRYSVSVAVADVDGDGAADVVAAGFDSQHVEVLRGDGRGGLGAPRRVVLGSGDVPTALALADVNADRRVDLLTANGAAGDVAVLLGDGRGGFGAARSFAAGGAPNALVVAEVTGDRFVDLVTANRESRDVSILAGNGRGGFAAPRRFAVGPGASPLALAVADATGDGRRDLVTANEFWDGGFPPPEQAGSLSVLAGLGAGRFAPAVQLPLASGAGRAQAVAIGDFSGDGRPDLLASLPLANRAALWVGEGGGAFRSAASVPTGAGPYALAPADWNRDGLLDAITANAVGESVSLLPGNGRGGLGLPGNFAAGAQPYGVVAADFDGDGRPDVATANAGGDSVSVLLGDGAGGLGESVQHATGDAPLALAAGDVDGDGALDLVAANASSGTVSVLLGDGAGGFGAAAHFSVGEGFHSPVAVALGDVDADGALDIATANQNVEDESASVLLGDGQGGFGAPLLLEVGPQPFHQPQAVALADVTADGHLDLLTANSNSGDLSLLAGDGAGGFAAPVSLATDVGPVALAVADVTGDGAADLISLNHTAQTTSVLAADGSGGFAPAVHYSIYTPAQLPCSVDPSGPCPWAWGLAVADVTGDGAADIVTANTSLDGISLLPNDGSGGFPSFEFVGTGAEPGSAAAADFDGDGRLDVVVANRANDGVSLLLHGVD